MKIINSPLGVHLSIAKGWDHLFKQAAALDCTTIQFFIKNARQWKCSLFDQDTVDLFLKAYHTSKINPLICHASYLINIVSTNPATASQSKKALLNELMLCSQLNIPYLVLHPGSNPDKKNAIEFFVKQIDEVLSTYEGSTVILLENSAGQGNYLGSEFKELSLLRNESRYKNRIAFCFDTCHAFTSGYHNFESYEGYQSLWNEWQQQIGIDNLRVIHLNDSAKPWGSHVDRHAHIGKGNMPIKWFEYLMNDEMLLKIPKILETPKKDINDDKDNLDKVRSLIKI